MDQPSSLGRAAAQRLAALDQAAIVAVTDTAGRITDCNDLFCQISGYERAELIGANHRLLQSGEHPVAMFKDMYRVIAGGGVWRGTICNRRKTGELYWVDTTIVPAPGPDGRPEAYVAIRFDVTHHKRVQAALDEARAAAERAGQARERFLANLSHELRTPLTAMRGFAEVLARSPLTPAQLDGVASIEDASQDLMNLVDDVLTLAQSRAGATPVRPRSTDLRALMQGCLKMVSLKARARGLDLRSEAAGLPERVKVDPVRVRQVILNLLNNAVKFTDQGHVRLALRWSDGALHCEVSDTGCGFAPEDKERLFTAFEQGLDEHGRHEDGAGLGLAICRGLIAALGGAMDAESRPGEGARFWFDIPCPSAAAPGPAPPAAEPAPAGADILVVEDAPEIQLLMQTILQAGGHRVAIAGNGRLGLDDLRHRPFDLCFMDMRMPVMGGIEAVRAIRADPCPRVRSTPVVMVSAEGRPEELDRYLAHGFNDVLGKPIDIRDLLGAVERWRRPAPTQAAEGAAA